MPEASTDDWMLRGASFSTCTSTLARAAQARLHERHGHDEHDEADDEQELLVHDNPRVNATSEAISTIRASGPSTTMVALTIERCVNA